MTTYSDADACAQALAAHRDQAVEAEAMTLTGEQARALRTALADAERCLASVITRGLGYRTEHQITRARQEIVSARSIIGKSAGAEGAAG